MNTTPFMRSVGMCASILFCCLAFGTATLAATPRQAETPAAAKGKKAGKPVAQAKSNYILPLRAMIEADYFVRRVMPGGRWAHIVWVVEHDNKSGTIEVEVDGKTARKHAFSFDGHDSIKLKDVETTPDDTVSANDLLTLKEPSPILTFRKEAPKNAGALTMMQGPDTYFMELKPKSDIWIPMRRISDETLLDCPFRFDWDAPLLTGVNYADKANAQARRLQHLWVEKREVELADNTVNEQGFVKTKAFGRLEIKVPAAPPSMLEGLYFQATCRATRPQLKSLVEWMATVSPTQPDTGGVRTQGIQINR